MRTLVIASSLALALIACAPKPTDAALPPAGLAGAPVAPVAPGMAGIAPSAALTTLPGAGHNVAPPSGEVPSSGQLPPGHPPIDTAAVDPAGLGAPAAPMGAGGGEVQLTGAVLETMDVPEYTYMRVKTSGGEEWVAVGKTTVAIGDTVTVSSQLVMENFASKSLNRTFPKLVMGMLVGAPKKP